MLLRSRVSLAGSLCLEHFCNLLVISFLRDLVEPPAFRRANPGIGSMVQQEADHLWFTPRDCKPQRSVPSFGVTRVNGVIVEGPIERSRILLKDRLNSLRQFVFDGVNECD
jgi:hypothetical protein